MWIDQTSLLKLKETAQISPSLYQWLALTQNLSKKINDTRNPFTLELCYQGFSTPLPEEHQFFVDSFSQADDGTYFVRQVILKGAGIPLIFARVIVPSVTYNHYAEAFKNLGEAPIGSTLLYGNAAIARTPFAFRQTDLQEPLIQIMQSFLNRSDLGTPWLRRSCFHLPRGSLLITESFLDNLFLLKTNKTCQVANTSPWDKDKDRESGYATMD